MGTAGLLLFLCLMIAGVVVILLFLLCGSYIFSGAPRGKSPYIKTSALRKIEDLHFEVFSLVEQYTQQEVPFKNQWSLEKALVCEQTGRIFPFKVKKFAFLPIPKSFHKKLHPGNWVQWDRLKETEKEYIKNAHTSLQGFNLAFQSPVAKPGPLYVDLNTGNLLGWKCVPNTDLEVIVFQASKD